MRFLRLILRLTLLLPLAVAPLTSMAEDYGWPREIATPKATITIYQPQPEKLEGNHLTGRAAISIRTRDRAEPIFGAVWLTATIETDRNLNLAMIRSLTVTRVRWPEVTPALAQRFTEVVESDFPKDGMTISLSRLSASLANAQHEQASIEGFSNAPPKMVFSEQAAVLLLYDGEPQTRPIDNSTLERVVNTPFAVVREKGKPTWYLGDGLGWYSATSPLGPWTPDARPPAEITRLAKPDPKASGRSRPTAVVVATEPTELIATDGKPDWQQTAAGRLLYVRNTETPWFREVESQKHYILLSGRWFASTAVAGPWTFVRPDQLPGAFAEIPPKSEVGGVRRFVAGTPEAEDALLDMQVPQTAVVKRADARLEVRWDGEPRFIDIPGTRVAYGDNTATQVLRIEGAYYAVDDGVWFTASNPTGPWRVADRVPKSEIDRIPPSAPVYNVRYVTVYQSTPEVVYVGYTPGYFWSYPYYGVPVYGTGWYYPPYWGPFYYPRPFTYGFHVAYNPWGGWGYGFSVSSGFLTVGFQFGGYGYYPGYHPPYYRPGYRPPVACYQCNINIGNSIGGGNLRPAARPAARPADLGNVYRDRPGTSTLSRPADLLADSGNRPAKGPNNVFSDLDGNLHRRTPAGWEAHDRGAWKPNPDFAAQMQQRPAMTGLERDFQARQRGSAGAMRQGGGRGGGRRR